VGSLPHAKIDGVCFWLDDSSPVIGLSMRHDRIDNFWFVLRHELEHVIQGHGKGDAPIVVDSNLEGERAGVGPDVAKDERIANAAAAEFCVPQKTSSSLGKLHSSLSATSSVSPLRCAFILAWLRANSNTEPGAMTGSGLT